MTGIVQDGAGTPLAGAVVVCNATAASAATDASGAFTLALPVGTHTLTVSKDGFASQAVGPLAVTSGAATAAGAIALGAAHGTLTVHVTDAASGAPVSGAVVTVPERAILARTDATGTAVLALAPGYLTASVQLGARQAGPTGILRVLPGSAQTVDLTLPATGWVEGSITLQEDGSPLVGGSAVLQRPRNASWIDVMTTRTDGAGHYRFEIAPGQYRLIAETSQLPTIDVTANQTTQVEPLAARGFGRIKALIAGPRANRAGHTITASWGLGGSQTVADPHRDADHTFDLTISRCGVSTLTFTDPEAYPLTFSDVALWNEHVLIFPQVKMVVYGSRKGFIHATSGEALDLADVTLDPTGRTTTSGVLAGTPPSHGYYRIAAPAGTYTVTVTAADGDGYIPTSVPGVTFIDGTTQPLDLTVGVQPGWDIASITLDPTTADPGGTVTGTITLTGPAPSRMTFDLAGNPIYLRNFVALRTSSAAVTVPANVEFAGGEQTKTFTVTVGANPPASATVTGTYWKAGYLMGGWKEYPGRTKTATLTILTPRVTALSLDPATVEPGAESTGTVTLDIPARPGGTTITLSSSNPAVATVPASVLVPEGATTATFAVTTLASAPVSAVTVTAAAGGASKTATLALALPRLYGVAPGWTLPGTADVIVYGAGFDQGSVVKIEGPVYALGAYETPLCDVVTFGCPTQTLAAAVDPAGTTATFTAPASLGTGLYRVTVRRSSGLTTPTSAWLAIDEASKTVPAQTPEEHRYAQAIHSGQTVTGTFVADGDPDGTYGDLNSYYFVAGAGARVSAILERVDTSKTWEHPDSLDPELLIATPAGYVPQNLASYDIQPGVDLNARLVNAVLPVSGLYVITAATTKGAGAYRLHFEMTQPGTVAGGARVVPYAQHAVTMCQGSTVAPTAMVLDGRGLRLSGARVGLGVVTNPGDTGAVTFTATTVASNPDGTAQTTLTATAQGRVEIAATALDSIADPPLPQAQQLAPGEQGTASGASQLGRIPRYQPVAYRPFVVTEAYGDLSIGFAAGKLEKVPAQRLRAARPGEQGAGQRGELRAHPPAGGTKAGGQASGHPVAQSTLEARPSAPDPAFDLPMDASTAVPLPEPEAEALALSTAGILACDQPTFALGIVPADTELHPPYTFTLTDLTPPAGGTQPQGEVGAEGITGHRIESTIRLKLEVKDALGQTPTHPVLVQLAVDGARHGHLVFDPDGTRRTCSAGAFLWHEPDGQGGVIPNDEVELTLGTLALWAGERPNPADPSHVLPVWGTAEVLDVAVQPIVDGAPAAPSVRGVRVHTEPGRPDHLSCAPDREDDCTTPWRLWADFAWNTDPVTGRRTVGPYTVHNLLFLHDPYDNVTFGQTATQATSGDPRVTPTFTDQTAGGTTFNACGYTVALKWEANPTMPAGQVPVTLEVERAADPDWGAGTIAKTLTLAFEQGASHCLVNAQHYDRRNGRVKGIEEGTFPLTVAPGAGAGGLPTTSLGDTPRLVLLALAGSDVPGYLLTAGTEPGPEADHQWRWHTQPAGWQYDETESSTPHAALELVDQPSFRFAIVDARNEVVPGTRFRVHRCPRYEHLTEPLVSPGDCTLAPVDSDGETGILPSLTLNEGGGANGRGYLGIELTKAPVAPGTYYVRVESLNGAAYRIRMGSNLSPGELDAQEEYAGAYMLCTVHGIKLLDEDLALVSKTLNMSINRAVTLQEIAPGRAEDSYQADVVLHNEDTDEDSTLSNVTFWRVGKTPFFMTGLITIVSPDLPLAPPTAAWNTAVSEQLDARLQGASPAGTLSPSRGRYTLLNRSTGENVKLVQVQRAATRLVEITGATPNFDAVTEGEGFADRRKIQADVTWGADGWVDLRLTNVDNASVFTFDYWQDGDDLVELTTPLRTTGGMPVCPPRNSTRGATLRLPDESQGANDPPFRAVVGTDNGTDVTVKPGLYRLVATYSAKPPGGSPTTPELYCDSDKPGQPLCRNEWVVSVGQRIFVEVEPAAKDNLQTDLGQVVLPGGTPEPALAFLDRVATQVTQRYQEASGNVTVRIGLAPAGIPRPFLTHVIKDSLERIGQMPYNYGQTRIDVKFPLLDPDALLATSSEEGISRKVVFMAPSWGVHSGGWPEHPPKQPGRNYPLCGSLANPCPGEILFNRYVSVVAHETAHGLGILSSKQWFQHGSPPEPASLSAFLTGPPPGGGVYQESPATEASDLFHEPLLSASGGFGVESPHANAWIMT